MPLVRCFCNFNYYSGPTFPSYFYFWINLFFCKKSLWPLASHSIFLFWPIALIQWALALNTHPFQWQLQILKDHVWDGKSVPYFLCSIYAFCFITGDLSAQTVSHYVMRVFLMDWDILNFSGLYANINLVHGLNSLLIGTSRR